MYSSGVMLMAAACLTNYWICLVWIWEFWWG